MFCSGICIFCVMMSCHLSNFPIKKEEEEEGKDWLDFILLILNVKTFILDETRPANVLQRLNANKVCDKGMWVKNIFLLATNKLTEMNQHYSFCVCFFFWFSSVVYFENALHSFKSTCKNKTKKNERPYFSSLSNIDVRSWIKG